MTVSLHFSREEYAAIKTFAKQKGLTVPELLRQSVFERMEKETDLRAYQNAYAAYQENPITYTLDEVEQQLMLCE